MLQGCHYREHSVLVETDRDRAILNIAQLAIEKYSLGDMPTTEDQETIAKGERQFTWRDLVLLPPWKREGILPTFRINGNSQLNINSDSSLFQVTTQFPFILHELPCFCMSLRACISF